MITPRLEGRFNQASYRRRFLSTVTSSVAVHGSTAPPLKIYTRPANSVSALSYGINPWDGANYQTQIGNAASAAASGGKILWFPPGNYRHQGRLTFTSIKVYGSGDATNIIAISMDTSADQGSCRMMGSAPEFRNFSVSQEDVGARQGAPWQAGLEVESASNFVIDGMHVRNAANSGIICWNGDTGGSESGPGRITNNLVHNSWADGIHVMRSSHDIIVAHNEVHHAGDDFISVVGYTAHPPGPSNVLVHRNYVHDHDFGRSITCVGGEDVTIQCNRVARDNMGGLMVATEGSNATGSNNNVLFRWNYVDTVCVNFTGYAGLYVYTDDSHTSVTTNVQYENNICIDSDEEGVKVLGTKNTNVKITNNHVFSSTVTNYSTPGGATNVVCSGNFSDGSPHSPTCGGTDNFTVTGSSLVYP